MRWTLLILAMFVTGCATAPPMDENTVTRIRQFKTNVEQNPLDDAKVRAERDALNHDVTDYNLLTVEQFAQTPEAAPVAFPLAWILVDRHHVDAAAGVIVTALLPDPTNRQYRMWKWWENQFAQRPDYEQLNHEMIEGLFKQFEEGPLDRRLVVAELFDLGPAEAALTPAQFRAKAFPTTQPAK